MPPKQKLTPSLTKNDWIDVARQGQWQNDYKDYVLLDYLEAKDIGEVFSNNLTAGVARSFVIRRCLDEFFQAQGVAIERLSNIRGYGECAPIFSNIEVAPNELVSCVAEASIFLKDKEGIKYILSLEPRQDCVIFSWYSLQKNQEKAQGLANALLTYTDKHNFLRGKKIDPGCNFISFEKSYTWDDLVIPAALKGQISTNLSTLLNNLEIYRKNNLTVKRGLIFSSPPGNGKTLLGKILCGTTDWTFLWVTPQYMTRPQDVAQVVSICTELSPTILFLEDVDLYGASREENRDTSVLGELMNQLDGVQDNANVITIATTNKLDVIEKALVERPGRFDKVIKFDLPQEDMRAELLKLFTKNTQLDADLDLTAIATLSNGLSGAQIRELVNFAVLTAVETKSYDEEQKIILKACHFKQALKSVQKKDFSRTLGFDKNKPRSNVDQRLRYYLDSFDE